MAKAFDTASRTNNCVEPPHQRADRRPKRHVALRPEESHTAHQMPQNAKFEVSKAAQVPGRDHPLCPTFRWLLSLRYRC